ncbi:MAG: NlpC/P60 family protein [Pseudomonadota bacterium]
MFRCSNFSNSIKTVPPLETKSATIDRAAIVGAVRDWLGTPYRHQTSVKHQGTDCLGLIRGVYRDLYGREPETPPPYTPDWNERRASEEPLLSAARRHLVPIADDTILPGHVLVFRVVEDGPAKHCGVATACDQFIHAYAGRAVIESWLSRWWRDRLVGLFDYPGAV